VALLHDLSKELLAHQSQNPVQIEDVTGKNVCGSPAYATKKSTEVGHLYEK
jgi:hypothetical protein